MTEPPLFAHARSLYPEWGRHWPARTVHESPRLLVLRVTEWRPRLPVAWFRWRRAPRGTFVFLTLYPYTFILCFPGRTP